ncbi:MAG: polysaccharide deacetylase family protein [Acidobacteriia bacterium]|nr:polysaccharide deacetylase family protein [Terriglobia bacterium]
MFRIILNFHGIGPITRKIYNGEHNCWLDQDFFEGVIDLVRGQEHVRLTFDDGNASDIEIVVPALLRRGLKATFFICSGRLGQPTFLNKAQVRELQAHGMSIGSHGVSHLSWCHQHATRLCEELEGSRQILEEVCGSTVDAAACPFGAYDRTVLSGLRHAGYRFVYTSDGGVSAANHWLRARNTVTRSMTIDSVALLIQRGPGTWKQTLIRARQIVKRLW